MPYRTTRKRTRRTELSLARFLALDIGPDPVHGPPDDLDVLKTVYLEHRDRFSASSWGARFFDDGVDTRIVCGPSSRR